MTQVDLLDGALGHAYVIIHVSSSPADFGWSFICRPRLFSILIRRRRSTMLADFRTIYQHICDSLATQIRSLTVASVFTASPSELLDAENRARMKHKLEPVPVCSLDWAYLLTPMQREYLAAYMSMWRKEIGSEPSHDAGCLFDLSQNPAFREMWIGVNRQIPTCAMQETFCGHLNMGDGFWPRNWHWPWASQSTRSLQKQHNVSRMLLDIFWSVVCFFESPSF